MKLALTITTVLAAVVDMASSAVTPAGVSGYIAKRQNGSATTPKASNINNFSYLFGWQLAGYFASQDESYAACSNLHSLGHGKWAAMGLNHNFIRAPICNTSHSDPDPAGVVPHVDVYATEIFTTHLLNSFNGTKRFAYLCQHLGPKMIASFPLNDQSVIGSVCSQARVQTAPQAEANLPFAKQNAVTAARNTASISFANVLAAASTSSMQLNIACAHAMEHVANLNKEQLNGSAVKSTLCQITEPILATEARHMLESWMSRYFITVLENISNVPGWLDWLCKNLDTQKMFSAGLNGYGVHSQVCWDATSDNAVATDD